MGELYRLYFPSGKSYIGITRTTATRRFSAHQRAAKNCQKGIVYQVWRRDGAPTLTVLAVIPNEDLYNAERRAIAVYGTKYPDGYNMTTGGDIPPSLTPAVAEKIRKKLLGRKLSLEHRRKISVAAIGRIRTAEHRANNGRSRRGKPLSVGHREKLSIAKIGRKIPVEVRVKMSRAQRNRRSVEGCTPQRWRYP